MYPFPKRQTLDPSKFKEFADDNFKCDESGKKCSEMGRKNCGKRRNCSLRAISPFPTVFSKDLYCRHVKTRACLGKGYDRSMLKPRFARARASNITDLPLDDKKHGLYVTIS